MISLPPAFQFSQSSLQDYVDCPRRFQLRYLLSCEWPAPVAEPIGDFEQADLLGRRFHKLIERHWLDIPVEREQLEPRLLVWWDAFVHQPPALPEGERLPEIETSAAVNGQRVVAKFDLLAYRPDGEAVIVDWKTSQRRPTRAWLDRRVQTLIYPFLLVESSPRLLGYQLSPENVRLTYWFADAPSQIEIFRYSEDRYNADRQNLTDLLNRVLTMDEASTWPLTSDVRMCRHCQYRSLCDRGQQAGPLDDIAEEEPLETSESFEVTESDSYVL